MLVDAVRDAMLAALRARGAVLLRRGAEGPRCRQLMWPDGKLSPAVIGQSARRSSRAAPGFDGHRARRSRRMLLVEEDGVGTDASVLRRKAQPGAGAVPRARLRRRRMHIVERIYAYQGAGHSVGLHSARAERALQLA